MSVFPGYLSVRISRPIPHNLGTHMVKLVDPTRWAPLIGRLFIAFGGIERTTHECIREWAGERIHKHFARAPLSSRIDLVCDLTEEQEASEAIKSVFVNSLLSAKKLAPNRNLVAHNPLCLVLLQDSPDDPLLEAIAHSTEEKYLSFDELAKIVEEAEHCSDELSHNFVAFSVEKLDVEHLKQFPGLPSTSA